MHENHRERLRERFLKEGLDSFEPHQALEMLLFYSISRRDTNELAHKLIAHFGSLAGVLDAHASELEKVDGVGPNSAVLLAMMKPLWRMYRMDCTQQGRLLDNCDTACVYAVSLFAGRTNESLYLLCLDPGCHLIREVLLQEGTVNEVSVHPRAVVEAALRCNATQVILAHNHPNGSMEPSSKDLLYTEKLMSTFSALGIVVLDHIIVSGEDCYSFARAGQLERSFMDAEMKRSHGSVIYTI